MLSRYYPKLEEWSRVLARGDEIAAEETVQDLCLHMSVAQPDLSGVNNLDNYLFMCLRNMYVSNLARVSRERLREIYIEDYDSVSLAAASQAFDTVDVQNELLRIGDYVTSRKTSVKTASHFILHFFLGYRRSDVALLARLPIAAVYNALNDIRRELREHVSASEKIRVMQRGAMPERKLLRTALPSDAFLKELRSVILDADPAGCNDENDLVGGYKQGSAPVGCRELAHLAGCERCLKILDRALQLDDRDGPFDGVDSDCRVQKKERKSFDTTMRLVEKRRSQLLERRPGILAIAVDGRVVAFHAVESAHNSLSSRVDAAAPVRFIEVFDEFGDRLAHVPLEEDTAGPRERLSQRLMLSDDRRLCLDVDFDGLGIKAEVEYFDPALTPHAGVEGYRPSTARDSWWSRLLIRPRFRLATWALPAFATVLVVVFTGYRFTHPAPEDVLARARAVTQAPSTDESLHQVLTIQEATGAKEQSILGTVDVWRSSSASSVRKLYNAKQELLATANESADGTSVVRVEKQLPQTQMERELIESGVWRSDVTTSAFTGGSGTEASRNLSGFEVTQRSGGHDGVLMRTLVLDRGYHVQAERVRFRTRDGVFEVRLVQTLLRTVPSQDIPLTALPELQQKVTPGESGEYGFSKQLGRHSVVDANLQVAVLFALFEQNADTGQPIEVSPQPEGRLRIAGTVNSAQLLADLRARMAALPNANRVDFQVHSAAQAASVAHRRKTQQQELVAGDKDAPAAGLVRQALMARGLSGTALQSAEQDFAASALAHAQTALQHAYALDRLGTILRSSGPSALDPGARLKWAQMVERHAAVAWSELKALQQQLDSLSAAMPVTPATEAGEIANATDFAAAAGKIRARAQAVNEEVVELFAGSAASLSASQARESITGLRSMLPVGEAERVQAFAIRLANIPGQPAIGEMRSR